jgi:DEAD/DEAH box helicase domain-containing protein
MATLSRHDGEKVRVQVPRSVGGAFTNHAVAQLLSFLATPPGTGVQDEGLSVVQRNVLWLNFLMVPDTPDEKTFVEGKMKGLLAQLPLDMQAPKPGFVPVLSKGDAAPTVLSWWPMAYASGAREGLSAPGVVLLDDVNFKDADTLHLNWRKWLALYNQQQMLTGMLLATRTAMDAGDCAGWSAAPQGGAGLGAASADQMMLAKDWADAIDQTLEPLRPGLRELAALQALLPLIGHELANERNQVVAEAEMAWPDKLLVLLTAEQEDMSDAWTGAGWTVLQLSENDLMLAGMPWPEAVVLNLNNPMSARGAQS